MPILFPVAKTTFHTNHTAEANAAIFKAKLLVTSLFALKTGAALDAVFKGRMRRNGAVCIKPNENALTAGNILFVSFAEDGRVIVRFLANFSFLLLFVLFVVQAAFTIAIAWKTKEHQHLTVWEFIRSGYLRSIYDSKLLLQLLLYSYLYYIFVYRHILNWRKLIAEVLNATY